MKEKTALLQRKPSASQAPATPAVPSPAVSTLTSGATTGTGERSDGGIRLPEAWSLTLLYHYDPGMIGARFCWPSTPGTCIQVNRHAPLFVRAEEPSSDGRGTPLGLSQVSRSSLVLRCTESGIVLTPETDRVAYEVNDRPGTAQERLSITALQSGVILSLGPGVVLLLTASTLITFEQGTLGIGGVSEAVRRVRAEILRLAGRDVSILISGESGTGKELVARALHQCSARRSAKLVAVNMAALTPSTAAAELFGHARGAFTGAIDARPGLFREADGGTLFLDEIGETPMEVQAMLLRVLESREIQPLGMAPRKVDVRILAATDANLQTMVGRGGFKRPLLYRLSASVILVPPLRERLADIPTLFVQFVRETLKEFGDPRILEARADRPVWLRRRDVLTLLRHSWPGNVRELKNLAYQTVAECFAEERAQLPAWFLEQVEGIEGKGAATSVEARNSEASEEGDLPDVSRKAAFRLTEVDRETVWNALESTDWKVGPASEVLGIARRSLYLLMARHHIRLAGSLTGEEILKASEQVGNLDPESLAAHLQVSPRGLRLRMRVLGLLG